MAPLEPWEKVLVSKDFTKTIHGQPGCVDCHEGVITASDKDAAHKGMITNPAITSVRICGNCHKEEHGTFASSLHSSLQGYWTALTSRSIASSMPKLTEMYGNHCASCHTDCGDCHISQPNSVGGGFLNGHIVEKTPPMTRTCTACHGSRVGNEYLGKHEDIPGDVHFRIGRMNCVSCHSGDSIHAAATGTAPHRYEGKQDPSCTNCHPKVGSSSDKITQHALHGDKLSCQVCHSITYTNCDNCHVEISKETKAPIFKTDKTYMGFFIGLNTRKDASRPYEYVPVRHVPIDVNSFSFYGDNLLPNFNKLPTWMYTTPHNIQRVTPQNQACNNCHGNKDIFLTADKVAKSELEANRGVIVTEPPKPVPGQ